VNPDQSNGLRPVGRQEARMRRKKFIRRGDVDANSNGLAEWRRTNEGRGRSKKNRKEPDGATGLGKAED